MSTGVIFDIKRFAIHDGPGIRTTLFLKGCPLSCFWCHNPEGIAPEPELAFNKKRCLADCAACREVCPNSVLSLVDGRVEIDHNRCSLCGTCAGICPSEALTLIGKEISPLEAMAEVCKDRAFYEESGGGVTFSGGEPLLQPVFLKEMLDRCQKQGIHTCLDTCGYAPPDLLDDISRQVDLFLFDLKLVDHTMHRLHTGVSNELILDNLKRLVGNGCSVVVRIPLIPGVNDGLEDIRRAAEFLQTLNGLKSVSLLPFHNIAADKYRRLGRNYRPGDIGISLEKSITAAKRILETVGLKVRIGSET
jgi:pyruvate formate lyase activating enzyme